LSVPVIAHRHDHSVDLKRRPPKSLPTVLREQFPDRESGPQGLRRPRFSFFRFTCQTTRDPEGPRLPFPHRGRQGIGSRRSSHIRLGLSSAGCSPLDSEGLRGTPTRHAAAACQGGLYRPALPPLSTASQLKTSLRRTRGAAIFAARFGSHDRGATALKPSGSAARAALRPHSSAVLERMCVGAMSQTGVATASSELSAFDGFAVQPFALTVRDRQGHCAIA
jgi:hypothetical protein